MSDLATRTAAPLVLATSRKLGAEIPAPLAKKLADVDRLRAERRTLRDVPDVAAAVADAILAGKDPLASKDVQRAALAGTLDGLNISGRLDTYAHDRSAAALLEHADEVIDTWRPTVERADKALKRFREFVPAGDPRADGHPTGLPAKALTPWGEAREAADLLEKIGQGWMALASIGAANVGGSGGRPIIVADLSAEQLASLGSNPKCIDVTRLDVTLNLASTTTYAERAERIAREEQERNAYAAAAPDRAREKRRELARQAGMGVVMIP
jgi:hypothetical protein